MFLHRDINKNYGYKVILVGGRVAQHNGRVTEGQGLTSGMAGWGRIPYFPGHKTLQDIRRTPFLAKKFLEKKYLGFFHEKTGL